MLAYVTSSAWSNGASLGLQVVIYLCATAMASVLALAVFVGPQDRHAMGRRTVWAMAGLGVAGVMGVAGTAAGLHGVCAAEGCLCAGVSVGYFETVWGRRFVSLRDDRIQPYTLLMTALAALMGVVCATMRGPVFFAVLAALPVGTAALLLYGERLDTAADGRGPGDAVCAHAASPAPASCEDPAVRERRQRALVNLLACCLVFSIIYSVVVELTHDYIPADRASQIRNAANLVAALGLLVLSLALRPLSSSSLFRLVLPVTAVGFVLYLVAPQALGWVSLAISGIGRKLFDILIWVFVAQAVRANALQPERYFGLLIAGKNLGYLLGLLLATVTLTYDPGVVQLMTVIPVLLLVLIVLFSWISPERTLEQLFGAVGLLERPREADLDQKAAVVARACGCTPREAEVLALLARGRTQAVIASKLGISTGTAHTHIVHVYQKLGVGKQQELIEKVEAATVEG